MHFSVLFCHASMHCWKDSSGMLLSSVITALLMASTPSKWVPLVIPLSLGKRNNIRWIGRLFPYGDVLLGQELWAGHCEQVHCRGEAATICPATTHVSSRALSEAKGAGSLCRLADWLSGPVARTHCRRYASDIEEYDQHDFDFWFWLSCFLRPRQCWRVVTLTALALGFRVVLRNPCLIISVDSTKQVWFSLKTLDDVLTHLHAVLLIIIQQLWHHFWADFLHERRCKQKHVKQN